jgi:sec-independent protein translocase protein TatA
MGRIGAWELALIVILVIVIFGSRRLPELGKGLGQGLANFRQVMREMNQSADQCGPKAEADPSDRA